VDVWWQKDYPCKKACRFYQWGKHFSKDDIQFHNMERDYSRSMKTVAFLHVDGKSRLRIRACGQTRYVYKYDNERPDAARDSAHAYNFVFVQPLSPPCLPN
jgi:hypothetical protein